jgi:hypothetical protein
MNFKAIVYLICFISLELSAQSKFRYFIPIDVNVGLSVARFEAISGSDISHSPGTSFVFGSGITAQYKNRVGLSFQGSMNLNEYRFNIIGQSSDHIYSVAAYNFNSRLRPYVLFPLKKNPHSVMRISCAGGMNYFTSDQLTSTDYGLTVVSTSFKSTTYFIAPEIGLTKSFRKMQFDLALIYHYNFAVNPVMQMNVSSATSSGIAKTDLNYFGLVVRFSHEILRNRSKKEIRKPDLKPELPEILLATELTERSSRESAIITSKKETIKLILWDNSQVDGDSISVYLNNRPIILNYGLIKKKKRIKLELQQGENNLVFVANNLGEVPPNTAAIRIRTGYKKHQLISTTTLKQNELIRIKYED